MKTLTFSPRAIRDFHKLKGGEGERIEAAIVGYAETGKADVEPVVGTGGGRRMRVGQWRVLFEESAQNISILAVVPRGQAYSKKALRAFAKRR